MTLSGLQKRIVAEIANHTINDRDDCTFFHDPKEGFISHSGLFRSVYSYWEDPLLDFAADQVGQTPASLKSRRAVFSRSLRELVKTKGLVGALTLAWVYVDDRHQDIYEYQGGGRPKTMKYETKSGELAVPEKTPTYRLLCLTEAGWKAARDLLGPDVGKCEHNKPKRRDKNDT